VWRTAAVRVIFPDRIDEIGILRSSIGYGIGKLDSIKHQIGLDFIDKNVNHTMYTIVL
jgi:hypothetical protein